MHHKFLVFCRARIRSEPLDFEFDLEPYEVWTGSFNFTENAVMSLENAVVLRDQGVVQAFFHEWEQIEAISEPLDWEADWSAPEWRVGTWQHMAEQAAATAGHATASFLKSEASSA